MIKHKSLAIFGCILTLAGCANHQLRPESIIDADPQPAIAAIENSHQSAGLTSGMVYDTLTSEIAAQRGDYATAFTHAQRAARETRDVAAAERAAHIALQANLTEEALSATQLWIELDPQSLKAHQIAALLHIRNQELDKSVHHLRQVTAIANTSGQNGYLQAAAIAEKTGSPAQSLALMQQVIPEDTADPEALYALALTASRAQQYAVAERSIQKALAYKPDWPKGLLLLSRTLILQGKKSDGLSTLGQAVEKSPQNQELRLTYARMLVEAQQYAPALEQFKTLDKQSPDNPEIIYALGVLSAELDQRKAAEKAFERLLAMGEKEGEAHYHLGLIAEKAHELDAALGQYRKVTGDNMLDARIRMARILTKNNAVDEARELLQQLRINSPHHALRLYLIEAELLRDVRKYHTAHEIYTFTLEQNPDNLDIYYARGLNAADTGRLDILEQDLKHIIEQQADHADALNALGYTLADRTNRLDEARRYIEKALALKPDNPAILDSMGWLEYREGNLEQALLYLQQAADLNPDAEISSHLGEVLWQLGRRQEALKVWNAANEKEPDNPYIKPVMQRFGVSP